MRLSDLIAAHPARAVAVIDPDGRQVTYGDLRAEARDLAQTYRAAGLRGGDRLVLVAENAAAFVVATLAASECDAWISLVNARMTAGELDAVIAHSQARLVTFTFDVSAAARAHADRLGGACVARTPSDTICLTAPRDVAPEPVRPGADHVAALLYTTGTTSTPKGVMLSHGNLCFNARGSAALNGLQAGEEVLAVLPCTHVFGLASMCLPALFAGATLRFVPRFDPGEVIGLLRGETRFFPGVPQMFARVVATLQGAPLGAPQLRRITTGGAPLDPELKARVEAAFGIPLNNGYGMTECAPTIAATRGGAPPGAVHCGLPLPGVTVRVDAPDAQGIGALQVGGANVMQGYFRAPDLTAAVMTEDGFFRTGDLGRIDAQGNVHVVGREKELIIRSGFNVYPPEIEGWLTKHPALSVAAVVGRAVQGNEEIVAFVVPTAPVTEAQIRDWLRDRLTAYKLPQRIVLADALPSAATGKVLKHKLLAHFAAELETHHD